DPGSLGRDGPRLELHVSPRLSGADHAEPLAELDRRLGALVGTRDDPVQPEGSEGVVEHGPAGLEGPPLAPMALLDAGGHPDALAAPAQTAHAEQPAVRG